MSIETNPNTVSPGKIQFLDYIQPPLPAGDYTLYAEQDINDLPGEAEAPSYQASQPLLVDGPRFVLDPAQIHSLYPPANTEGNFDEALPNIVFNNFALPWSREINPADTSSLDANNGGGGEINQIPWMGLLTIYASEMTGEDPNVPAPVSVTASKLITADPSDSDVLLPNLGSLQGGSPDQKVAVMDVKLPFFQQIAPKLSELPYLAHARSVNTDGKPMLGMNDDGSFSVVIGNRLPEAGDQNTMYLVSYEGHQDHLNGATIDPKYKKIRLVVLGTWQFTANTSRGDFLNLMEDLCDEGRGGVKLFQMPMDADTIGESAVAKEALEIGYVALQNEMRIGEETTSWYRGPLVPSPTKRDHEYGPYLYSDHAMHYDPDTGIFNHAYSAAWQIGRLLALSDGSFAGRLFNWRNEYLREAVKAAKAEGVNARSAALTRRPSADADDAGETPQPEEEGFVARTRNMLSGKVAGVAWPKLATRAETMIGEELPGVLTTEEKEAIHNNDEDPLVALMQKIKGS